MEAHIKITRKLIQWVQADGKDPWHISNGILYQACRDYPDHTDKDEIIAKILLIGRAYAASIERGDLKMRQGSRDNDLCLHRRRCTGN